MCPWSFLILSEHCQHKQARNKGKRPPKKGGGTRSLVPQMFLTVCHDSEACDTWLWGCQNGAVTWSVIGKTLLRLGFPLSVYRAWPQTGGSSRPLQSESEPRPRWSESTLLQLFSAVDAHCPFPALDSTIIRTCNLGLSVLREGPLKFSERPVLLPGFTN